LKNIALRLLAFDSNVLYVKISCYTLSSVILIKLLYGVSLKPSIPASSAISEYVFIPHIK